MKDRLIEEEASKVFMFNKFHKAQTQLRELETSVRAKTKELEGLETLYAAYSENPALGSASDVHEVWFSASALTARTCSFCGGISPSCNACN